MLAVIEKRKGYQKDVISVTGSCGKSTTTGMCHAVLSSQYTVHRNHIDGNTLIGVASAIERIFSVTDDMWLCEMGIGHPGDMKKTLSVLNPTVKILTNVGDAHRRAFRTLENLHREKLSYLDDLTNTSVIIINNDNPQIREYVSNIKPVDVFDWKSYVGKYPDLKRLGINSEEKAIWHWKRYGKKEQKSVKIIRCGTSSTDDIQLLDHVIQDNISSRARFKTPKGEISILLNTIGKAYAFDAGYAIACGIHYNIPLNKIAAALGKFQLYKNRGSIHVFKNATVYNHTYNCSTLAVITNLTNFASISMIPGSVKIIVIDSTYAATTLQAARAITPNVIVYGMHNPRENFPNMHMLVNRIAELAKGGYVYLYMHANLCIINKRRTPLFELLEPMLTTILDKTV